MLAKEVWTTPSHPALVRALELAEKAYPKHEISIARDGGDVIELWLQDVEEYQHSACLHASYNKWYDEISFYTFMPIE